jgi:DNA-directed RNA polymerase
MQTFTGTEYLKIDIANCFGLDRETWTKRLEWVEQNETHLESLDNQAKNPILFRKSVRALRTAQQGKPVNHVMGLDATASGLQIMACMSGCVATGRAVNLVDLGRRADVYQAISDSMNIQHGCNTDRDLLKKPVMTVFYGSKAQPKQIFGEGEELDAFYDSLYETLPGAYQLMDILQSYWRSDVEYHSWSLPDGHIAKVPVTTVVDKQLEIDELDHLRMTYRCKVIQPQHFSRSLAANIVHSVDGFVVRQMVAAAKQQGFWLAPIHDCFYAHPNYMNQVRENYAKILAWIARNNILQSILSDISGRKQRYSPVKQDLDKHILKSEYALS